MVRSSVRSRTSTVVVAALGPLLAFSLVACGGSSSSGSASAASAPTPTATGGFRGNGANSAEFAKIQACLSAAGISLPTGSGGPRPTGSFTRPSGTARPSGPRPSGGRGFGQGGGAGMFSSPQVKAALKACGITVPTGGARPSATTG